MTGRSERRLLCFNPTSVSATVATGTDWWPTNAPQQGRGSRSTSTVRSRPRIYDLDPNPCQVRGLCLLRVYLCIH